ncbi:MAG: NYN domain-containing protein [Candidatus Heimdallarchaeaceae archaeon]
MTIKNNESETEEGKSRLEKLAERVGSISYVQSLKSLISKEKKVAVIVDGPNFLRKINEKYIKLEDLEDQIRHEGKIIIKKVLLNEYASENLIIAITNSGYEPIVSSHDIYIEMAILAMQVLVKKVDIVVLATRHARAVPILQKVKEKGVETAIIAYEPGLSIALQKTADKTFLIPIE